MRIVSWNINGVRSAGKKGLFDFIESTDADVIGLQEVRAHHNDIPSEYSTHPNWRTHFSCAQRKGYSGVGLLSRQPWDKLEHCTGIEAFDCEGRLQFVEFGKLLIVNGYFPNGSGKNRDNSRVPFKLEFYRHLYQRLEQTTRPMLIIGDFNIAHQPIDLARPKQNETTSGFLPEERQELTRWLDSGWTDTFRYFEKGPGHYSWWSQRQGARERNIGWRIDYVLANTQAMPYVKRAFIWPHVLGSDHCPIGVDVDPEIVRS